MQRAKWMVLLLLVFLAPHAPARAGWHSFWDRVHLDWHRMNCWPQPFIHVDRNAARLPVETMVRNGWARQNTLGDHHFHKETNQLTEAGELKLRWILTQAPPQHRNVFVMRGVSPDISQVRVDSVQQTVARVQPEGPTPSIIPTHIQPRGVPAEFIDAIDRKINSSIPDPRLPNSSGN